MIDLKLLNRLGCNAKTLKAAFTAKKLDPKIEAWTKQASDRIREAVESNTRDYRLFLSIDRAIDSPFFARSLTLFQGLFTNKWDSKKVLSVLNEWGAGDWIKTKCGCGNSCSDVSTCRTQVKVPDIPALIEVHFPIALAYLSIRVARMYNERNLSPLLPYTPRVNTPEERLMAQILTQRVDIQGAQMNHNAVLKQLIRQSTAYGECVLFPVEAWYADQQPTDEMKGKKRVMRTAREGIRYEHPHPTRSYRDLSHPAYTLNTGTGCRFGGNWALVPYGVVVDNKDYWNTDEISYGKDAFRITESNRLFFELAYPCSMSFPTASEDESVIVGKIDRQKRMNYYTKADRDKGVLLTNHFELVNPLRDWGLKNKDGEGYDGEVWFRTSFSGYDTVIHVEPLAYRAMTWSGYDADANRFRNSSIVLETIPAEDMIHNLFSQAVQQAKNNLINWNFVNTDAIGTESLDGIKNLGQKIFQGPQFIEYSAHESRSLADENQAAIIPVQIQRMPIGDLLTLVKGVLDLLERALVMSSQEIASSASHEQTAQEVHQTAQSTSTRLAYTGSFIDDAIYAWQEQLADAGAAYWDDEITVQVALQEEGDEATLKKMGFTIKGRNEAERTAKVSGSKKVFVNALHFMRRDAADRINNPALAAQMVQLFTAFSQNPILIEAIGTGQVVKVFNEIATIAGLPRDFRLSAVNDPIKDAKDAQKQQQEQAQNTSGELQKILPQIAQKIQQETIAAVGEQLKPVFEQSAQLDHQQEVKIQALEQNAQQAQQAFQELAQKLAPLIAAAQPPPPPMQAQIMPPPMGTMTQ